MSVFVTVGSTSFDELIRTVSSPETLQLLSNHGFKEITFQIGNGTYTPSDNNNIKVSWFRYKDSIEDDIKFADLIIGHGGAGTTLESLSAQKPLIVVLNDKLMDNHQNELAEQMGKDGYLLYCNCDGVRLTLSKFFEMKKLRPYISEPNMFPRYLEQFVGLR